MFITAINRYTALHFAAEANRQADEGEIPQEIQAKFAECCKVLVEDYGAGVQPIASTLVTPLHIAADVGNTQVANFLLTHGANPNATNTQGQSTHCNINSPSRYSIFIVIL